MSRKTIEFEESSGNVFKDIGFNDDEAEELLAKAELARQISKAIAGRRLTNSAAARVLHVDRAKVSKILNGHLTDFSIGRMMAFLRRLNRDVEIRITARRRFGKLRVKAA